MDSSLLHCIIHYGETKKTSYIRRTTLFGSSLHVVSISRTKEYDRVSDVVESWVAFRSDFQSGSRVLQKSGHKSWLLKRWSLNIVTDNWTLKITHYYVILGIHFNHLMIITAEIWVLSGEPIKNLHSC